MPYVPQTSLEALVATCERIYARDGFVKWADVATEHGISRQAVQARLKKATESGHLSPEDVTRWMSMSARLTQTKRNAEARKAQERLRIQLTLTPENGDWLWRECDIRGLRTGDIINGLITKARSSEQ